MTATLAVLTNNVKHGHRLGPERLLLRDCATLGMPRFTAYAGLLEIRRPKPGETVVVAAATGPVVSAVGQIARVKGARVVGIAGGPDKCGALLDDFGYDAAVDHRSENFAKDLAAAVPDGIDVYFENVGGRVAAEVARHYNLDAALVRMVTAPSVGVADVDRAVRGLSDVLLAHLAYEESQLVGPLNAMSIGVVTSRQ